MRIWRLVQTAENTVMNRYIKLYILLLVLGYSLPGIGLAEEVPGKPGNEIPGIQVDMDRIMQIESGGDTKAYNKHSQARGLYQVTPICLKDFNKVNGTSYKVDDLFEPQINARIAYWYINERLPKLLEAQGGPITVDRVLAAYNTGPGRSNRKPWPKETRDYIVKYHKGAK